MTVSGLGLQPIEKPLHFRWPLRFKCHQLAVSWQSKLKYCSMQRETGDAACVFNVRSSHWATVFNVTADRVAQLREMNTNLIRASGFESAFQLAEDRKSVV